MKVTVVSAQEDLPLLPDLSGRKFTVLDEYLAVVEIDDRILKIKIPAGFETDLASVPRILWSWIPPTGKYLRAAVVHDYLYCVQTVSKAEADAIFKAMSRFFGVGWMRAQLMYIAVRIGGRYR